MKKIFIIILSAVLILVFSSCGDVDVPTENPDTSEIDINDSSNNYENENVTVDEQVILDEKDIKITITGYEADSFMGPELKVLIENNSSENLTIQTRSLSINGYMADALFSCDVAAGKKSNDTITLSISEFIKPYTNQIADIEFSFHIFNSDSWETYFDTQKISIKTSAFDNYNYESDASGEILFENENIKIIFKGLTEDFLGSGFILYVENNGENNITIQTRDVSVNGFMIDPMYSAEVDSGKISIDSASFFSSDFEENGITDINELEFYLHIFDTNSWDAIIDTDIITLTF